MTSEWSGQMAEEYDKALIEYGCRYCGYEHMLKEIKRIIHQDGQDFTDGEIIDQISGLLETGYWYFMDNKNEPTSNKGDR
jgi:hypothetical protein